MLIFVDKFIYDSPPWQSSIVFVLAGIIASGLMLLVTSRLVAEETRHSHNEFTLFTVTNISVLYAVLLAFVAMVVWEHYNAATATSYAEAGFVRDVYNVSLGFSDPEKSLLRDGILGYVETVVGVEWPAQARGLSVAGNSVWLNKLNAIAAGLKPSGTADGNRQAMLLQSLMRLSDAR